MYSAPLSEPRRKRPREGEVLQQAFPVTISTLPGGGDDSNTTWRWYAGTLTANHRVEVEDGGATLWEKGYFGEPASLLPDKHGSVALVEVQPGKEDEANNVEEKVVQAEEDSSGERVHLNFCEAFFLSYALGCLLVSSTEEGERRDLSLDEMWTEFCSKEKDFPLRYATYHHFRAKGWVVRPGEAKFGCDFLLYKHGPPFYHASYSVLVQEEDSSMSWRDLSGLNRVTESAAKELLLSRVQRTEGGSSSAALQSPGEALKTLLVREVLVRRWVPSQEREEM